MDLLKYRDPRIRVTSGCHTWTFPNGLTVGVVPDDTPLRWLLCPDLPDGTEGPEEPGLNGEQVEARLAEIAALPAKEGS